MRVACATRRCSPLRPYFNFPATSAQLYAKDIAKKKVGQTRGKKKRGRGRDAAVRIVNPVEIWLGQPFNRVPKRVRKFLRASRREIPAAAATAAS